MTRIAGQAGMLVLLLAAPVFAQFAGLATTDDGSQLYFSSRMSFKGREPGPWPESRVYRHGSAGLTLYAERGALAPRDTGSSSDGVGNPSVSGDGSVVAIRYTGVCLDAVCSTVGDRVEVRGRETFTLPGGEVQVSRNGRWALVTRYPFTSDGPVLVDLTTGQRAVIPPEISVDRVAGAALASLASDGTFLAAKLPTRGIWKEGQFRPIPAPAGTGPIALSDDGAVVILYGSTIRIGALSLATGEVTAVVESQDPDRIFHFHSVSNNGRRVLYSAGTQHAFYGPAYVWDASTKTSVAVPLEAGEAVTAGVLSGDGAVAFVTTTRFRIVRFDLGAGKASPLFPQTPYCDDPSPVANGSFTTLRCSFSGSAEDLKGRLVFSGGAAPVLYSSPGEIGIQVPWQRGFFGSELKLDIASDAPFLASQTIREFDGAPQILTDSRGLFGMAAVRGDWSALLTAAPPAGEMFHVYMTGLGPLKNHETTGVPASLTKPNPIEWNLSCEFVPWRKPAELLFAGIAPGMLGIYQTTFRAPQSAPGGAPPEGFQCTLESPAMRVPFAPGDARTAVIGRGGIGTFPVPTPPLPPC